MLDYLHEQCSEMYNEMLKLENEYKNTLERQKIYEKVKHNQYFFTIPFSEAKILCDNDIDPSKLIDAKLKYQNYNLIGYANSNLILSHNCLTKNASEPLIKEGYVEKCDKLKIQIELLSTKLDDIQNQIKKAHNKRCKILRLNETKFERWADELIIKAFKMKLAKLGFDYKEINIIYDGMDKTNYNLDYNPNNHKHKRFIDTDNIIKRIQNFKRCYPNARVFNLSKYISEDKLPPTNYYEIDYICQDGIIIRNWF